MKTLTPIQKLDTVLKYLNHDKIEMDAIPEDSGILKNISFETTNKEINLILNKLIDDKYVKSMTMPLAEDWVKGVTNMTDYFFITYNGRMFIKNGGYKWYYRMKLIRRIFNVISTLLLALGSVALAVIEIMKYLNNEK